VNNATASTSLASTSSSVAQVAATPNFSAAVLHFLVEMGRGGRAAHLRVAFEQRDEVLRKLPRPHDADFDAHGRRFSSGRRPDFNANPAD